MAVEVGSIEYLSQVISQVVGPSFLLGAVAAFISMLFARIGILAERIKALRPLTEDDPTTLSFRSDIPILRARLRRLHRAVLLAVASGIATTILIVAAFLMALFRLEHVWGSAILFIVSLSFFCASLTLLGLDVKHSIGEYDRY